MSIPTHLPANNLHLSPHQRHRLPQIHRRAQLKSSHYKPSQLLARSARLIFRNPSLTTRSSRPSSPKPINPLALLPLLGSPLKSSVLSLPAAVWNASTSHHTHFFYLKLLWSSTNRYHKFIAAAKKPFYATLVQSFSSKPRALW